MRLDMLKVASLFERCITPVQLAHPAMQIRIPIPDRADIALERSMVSNIKPYDCRKQPDIRLGKSSAHKVLFTGQKGFDAVQPREKSRYGTFVCLLCRCKARSVDAI